MVSPHLTAAWNHWIERWAKAPPNASSPTAPLPDSSASTWSAAKLSAAARGENAAILSYKRAAAWLDRFERLGLATLAVQLIVSLRCYPSCLFTASKPARG